MSSDDSRYLDKEYKTHFACFTCRKAFKKTMMREFYAHKGMAQAYRWLFAADLQASERKACEQRYGTDAATMRKAYLREAGKCPQCSGPMAEMSLDFQAPPQKDTAAWAIIEVMRGRGWTDVDTAPRKLSQLSAYFARYTNRSPGDLLAERIVKRAGRRRKLR